MYYANFNNNGTRLINPSESANKRKLMRHIIALAKSEHLIGCTGHWSVWDDDERTIAEGYIDANGHNHFYKF